MIKLKLSVLVTFYNQEEYVDTTIQSILSQETEFEYEIVVGDDGSTDKTQMLIREWIKKYPDKIQLHIMKRDPSKKYNSSCRASIHRLNLLKYVTGEYFMFLDGDDYICCKEKFQKEIDILERVENRDCIACAHNSYIDKERNKKRISRKYLNSIKLPEQKFTLERYWEKYYFHPDSIICRSEVIKNFPYQKIKYDFNDNMITFCMLQYGKLYYYPETMTVYRQDGKGIWTGQSLDVGIIRSMFDWELEREINPQLKKESLLRHYNEFVYLYEKRNVIKKDEMQFYYILSKRIHLKEPIKWITYRDASVLKKICYTMQFYYRKICVALYKVKKCLVKKER